MASTEHRRVPFRFFKRTTFIWRQEADPKGAASAADSLPIKIGKTAKLSIIQALHLPRTLPLKEQQKLELICFPAISLSLWPSPLVAYRSKFILT